MDKEKNQVKEIFEDTAQATVSAAQLVATPIVKTVDGLFNVFKGMYTVVKHVGRDPITGLYPHKMPELYPRSRHRLALNVNPDTGEHLCIACKQCERVCPDTCITVIPHDTVKAKSSQFYIDHGLCMFCGLCTEVCPTDCIINTVDFEMTEETREDLVYDIKRLTLSQEQSRSYFEMKEIPKPKPKPAKKPAAAAGAAAAKTAPKPAPKKD